MRLADEKWTEGDCFGATELEFPRFGVLEGERLTDEDLGGVEGTF